MAEIIILDVLKQIAKGIAAQFGTDCEVVVHSLRDNDIESSIAAIENGHVTNRKLNDGPSRAVLEALSDKGAHEDHLAYLTKTRDGKVLKSSTIIIRDDKARPTHVLSINYDITALSVAQNGINALLNTQKPEEDEPQAIVQSVNELLDELIDKAMKIANKPVALMTKDDKVRAVQFLNQQGAFLITKSGDKVSKHFGISKYTLYSYIDAEQ